MTSSTVVLTDNSAPPLSASASASTLAPGSTMASHLPPTAASPPSTKSASTSSAHPTLTSIDEQALDHESALSPTPSLDTTYPPSRPLPALAQPDRGRPALLFLLGAFSVELVIWGIPSAYGVFLVYYQTQYDSALLPWVGSLCSGGMYILGPVVALALNPRPQWRVGAVRVGCGLIPVSLLASSFARTVSVTRVCGS